MNAQHTWRACVAAMLLGGTLCRAFLAARPSPSVARPSCMIARRQQAGSGVQELVLRVRGDQWWGTKDSIAWEKALLSATASPSPGSSETQIQTHTHTHTQHTSVCVHTCKHAYIHTCIHTYMHTYIHTGMYLYMYTYIYAGRRVGVP
jgi:hypothetical protein